MNLPLERLEKICHDFLFQEPINWAGYYAMCAFIAVHFENQDSLDYYMNRLEEVSNDLQVSCLQAKPAV